MTVTRQHAVKAPQPQLEKPAANSWLVRLGRIGVAGLLVFAIYYTISGWWYLFGPAPKAVQHELATADRWDRLPAAMSAPGHWSVLGSAWRAELQRTLPNQVVDDSFQVHAIPADLPPESDQERELVALLAQITSPVATEYEGILCRKTRFAWGQITAATARVDAAERLLEAVINFSDASGGYHIRVRPNNDKAATQEETLGVAMPAGALRMGTMFDDAQHALCEIWMTDASLEACEQTWKTAGWSLEVSPSEQASSCMLSRQDESICALLPSGKATGGRRNMILLVRLSGASSAAVAVSQ